MPGIILKPLNAKPVDQNLTKSDFQQVNNANGPSSFESTVKYAPDTLSTKTAQTSSNSSTVTMTDNSTVRYKNVDTPYASQKPVNQNALKDLKARPNILNQFANYTYHVVFSMMGESDAISVTPSTNLSQKNRIIIAESGATVGFNITKFTINNTVSPGFKNRNQNLMEWTMTITEPFGLTFPDYILVGAETLKIRNPNRFPFFIEVWFTGYDNDGNIIAPNFTRRIWRVVMLDMNLSNDQTGTVYELNGIMDNDIGSSDQFALTDTTINLDQIQTFGGAIAQLKDALNKASKDATKTNEPIITYDIQMPTTVDVSSWSIIPPDPAKDQSRTDSTIGEGKTLTLNKGTDIGTFITSLMGKCGNEADAFLCGKSSSGSSASLEAQGLGNIMQVFTEVQYGDYNDTLQDYKKTIIFKLIPYYTTRVVRSPEMAKQVSDETVQFNRLQFLMDYNLLAKKYEWIYTGQNTEVLKFDMRIDHYWSIAMPSFFGGSSYGQVTQGLIVNSMSQYVKENLKQIDQFKIADIVSAKAKAPDASLSGVSPYAFAKSLQSQLPSGLQSTISQASGLAASAQSKINNLTNMASTIQNFTSGTLNNITGANVLQTIGSLQSLASGSLAVFGGSGTNTLTSIINGVRSVANSVTLGSYPSGNSSQTSARKEKYLEDLKSAIESGNADKIKVAFTFAKPPAGQDIVNNGGETINQLDNNTIAAGGTASGQSIFAQTVKNVYSNTFFLQIELEVRGDPWWIGMTNIEQTAYSKSLTTGNVNESRKGDFGNTNSNESTMDGKANFMLGENMFLLNFATGTNYNQDTGLMNLNKNTEFFNGVYFVLEVNNRFENGSFTQTLRAVKEVFSQTAGSQAAKSTSGTSTGWMDGNSSPKPESYEPLAFNGNMTASGMDISLM